MDSLRQQKLFVTREFELKDHGLRYRFKDLTSSFELEIPYEEIGTRRIDQKLSNNLQIGFVVFMIAAASAKTFYLFAGDHDDYLFTLIVIGITIFSFLLAYYGHKDFILIEAANPQYIEFYSKRPDSDSVEKFIAELRQRTKDFLIKKYAERDINIPLEAQLEAVSVLKNRNIINEKEYEELTNKLAKPKSNPIGF